MHIHSYRYIQAMTMHNIHADVDIVHWHCGQKIGTAGDCSLLTAAL